MKTRNRLLAMLLTLVMIISMLPISAFAENDPPATGTDIAIENPNGSEKEPAKEGTGGSKDQGNGGNGNVGGTPGVMPDPTYANITLACGKGGSVTDLSNTAKSGSIVRFKTVPETDYSLDTVSAYDSGGSNVAVSSMGDSHSFTMPASGENVTVTVQFKENDSSTPTHGESGNQENAPETYPVTLTCDPEAGGTVTGGGTVTAGQSVTVEAAAKSGYSFEGWYNGTTFVSSDNPYTFTPAGDVTLTAKFKQAFIAPTPIKLIVDSANARKIYHKGDSLDVQGLKLSVSYNTGMTTELQMDDTALAGLISGYDSGRLGKQTLTVTYTAYGFSLTGTYQVTVVEKNDPLGFTITLDANRGTVNGSNKITVKTNEYGRIVQDLPTPSPIHDAIEFMGWSTEKRFDRLAMQDVITTGENGTAFSEDTTVYALWNDQGRLYYANFYDGDDLLFVRAVYKRLNLLMDAGSDPTKDGHTFAGWYADKTLQTPLTFPLPLTEDIDIFAKFVPVNATAKIKTKLLVMPILGIVDPSESAVFGFMIGTEDDQPLPAGTVQAAQLTLPPQATLDLYGEYNAGMVEVPASTLSTGTNTLSLSWAGDESYEGCSATVTFTVANKKSLKLVEYAATLGKPGEPYTISGRFLDEDDQPLADTEITIRTQQEPGSTSMLPWFVDTDKDGRFSYTVSQNLMYIHEGDTLDVAIFVEASITHLAFAKKDQLLFSSTPSPQYSVSVEADPAAGGTVTGGGTYTEGESVTVMITDIDEDYVFGGWYKGDERVTTSRNHTFTCTEDLALTARFIEKTEISYSLSPSSVVDLDGEPFMIKVTLTGAQGSSLPSAEYAKLTLSFNGSAVGQYIAFEKAFMVAASDLEVGEHVLQLNYPGSDKYLSRSSVVNVEVVKKQALQLVDFAPTSVPLSTGYTITGRILDENDLPVKDKALIIFVPDDEGSSTGYSLDATTGNDGSFSASVNQYLPTSEGKRTISIICSADDSYKPLRKSREISFADVSTHTVTFIIENGVWEGESTAQKTVTLAENSTIQAGDLPVPQPDGGYGVGAWDVNPVGQTVTGDANYTYSYKHYKVSYVMVNGDASIGTAPADSMTEWWGTESREIIGGANLRIKPKISNETYDFGGTWYTDQACTQEADAWAEVSGDVTLYGKWTGTFSLIDEVLLDFTPPKVGDTIQTGAYTGTSPVSGIEVSQPSSMAGKTIIAHANYELEGVTETSFQAGKTYTLRVVIGVADPLTQRFKGHGGGLDRYALTVTGADATWIDFVAGTQTAVLLDFTPTQPPVSKPVNVTVTGNTASADYDGTEKSVSGFGFTAKDSDDGDVSGVTVTLKSAHADAASIAKTDAGEYDMDLKAEYFDITLPEGCTLGTVKVNDGKLTISPAAVTVTANNSSKQFGAADPEFTAVVSGLIGTDTITYSVTRPGAGNDEAVGTYTGAIVATGKTEQGNYTVTYKNGDFTIMATNILSLTVTDYSGVYDGRAHGAAATANVDGAEIVYSTDNGSTWSSTVPQIRDVGTITVTAKATADGYAEKTATYTLTVTTAPLSITTGSASREYNGEALTAAGTITGLISGETVTVTTTGSQTYVGSSENTYTINWGTVKAINYKITENLGTLEVTAAEQKPTITATATLTTGGNELDLRDLVSGAQDEPTFSIKSGGEYATLSGTTLTSGDNHGTLIITVRIDEVDMNGDGKSEYKDYTGTVSITVEKNTNPPTPTGRVEADPVSLSFGSVQQGYAPITPKPVTIRNNTAASVTISALGGLTAFEATAMDASAKPVTLPYTLPAGESINLAVHPKSDLAANSYSETLTVAYNDGTDKTLSVALRFTVTGTPPQPTTISYAAKDGSGNTIQSVTWQKGSAKSLDLTFHRSEDDHLTYGLFGSLEIGGVTVGSANYGSAEGSLKLSIKPEYLETLSVGDHTVKVNFQDGSATVKLTVLAASAQPTPSPTPKPSEKPTSPKTGDESNLALWSSLMFLSVAAMIVLLLYARKRKTEK